MPLLDIGNFPFGRIPTAILKGHLATLVISLLIFNFVVACFLIELPLQVCSVYFHNTFYHVHVLLSELANFISFVRKRCPQNDEAERQQFSPRKLLVSLITAGAKLCRKVDLDGQSCPLLL